MTNTVEVAVGEIVRVAAWGLRGLDIKFGVAERAAPIVAWAEAVEGCALEALRTKTSHLSSRPPANWLSQVSPTFWKVDATGRSLLEIGPVAIDLLTLAARTRRVGRVDFANAVDLRFLSGVARIGARRRLGIVALSSGRELTLCGKPVKSIHAFPGPYRSAFEENNLPQDKEIANAIAEWSRNNGPTERGEATFSLLSYEPLDLETRYVRSRSFDDAERKFAFAQSHGIQVRREDLAHLYQLEIRTWAPTSERSRKQALF